jgi:hypothetical protein
VTVASLFRACAHALCAIGEYRQVAQMVADATGPLQPGLRGASPAFLSVYGSLHLVGALAAARHDDRSTAGKHLAEAAECASRLGGDANHVWTAFGPTNVAIHRVSVAMELGDVQVALSVGPQVDTSRLPVERRVRHAIEIARAYRRRNQPDSALEQLLTAERLAPEQVRYHYLSREVVRSIIKRPTVPRVAIDLAQRMGVAGTVLGK